MKKARLVFVLFVLIILFSLPSFATFEIDNFTIDANVLPNGDMEVRETINYYTNETVNGLTRDIEIKNKYNTTNSADSITLQAVCVDGEVYQSVGYAEKGDSGVYTYYTSSEGGNITLYSPFVNKYKTAEYYYTLSNVAVKYADTAELFWNFIGSEWDCSIKKLAINVTLPEVAAQDTIWVYGHGSDNGTFTKSENYITLNVNNINAYQAVDARILFSRNAIPESTKVYSKSVLKDYINHEEGMSKELEAKKALFGLSVKEVSFVLSVIILAIGVGIYIFFDKEERVEKVQYFRELPYGLEPEMLQYIYYGKVKSDSFYVAILNLIKLGVYKLENTVNKVGKETQKIIYNSEHNVVLKEYQKRVVKSVNGFLEDEANGQKSIDLLKLSSKMEKSSGTGYRMFVKDLEAEKEGLLGKPSKAPKKIVFYAALALISMIAFITLMGFVVGCGDEVIAIPMVMGFISLFYSIFFAAVGNSLPVIAFLIFHMGCFHGAIIAMLVSMGIGWLYIPYLLTFILIQYIVRIKKYPKEERQIVEYIKGLKRYIKHYSMLDEKDGVMESLALWEDYFIMAVALGLNTKTINYFYEYGKAQHSNLGNSMRCVVSYRDFSYGMSTPFHNYSRGYVVSSGGGSSSYGGSSHSGSSGGFSGGSSSGGGGGRRRRRWTFLKNKIERRFL